MTEQVDYAAFGPIDMNPEIRAQWARALRKGRFSQGMSRLTSLRRHGRRKHCCLGVLCVLAVAAGVLPAGDVKDNGYDRYIQYGKQAHYLPEEVMAWAGLAEENPRYGDHVDNTLAGLNDQEVPFRDIADVIDGGEGSDA